jgi:hypothetical protein
MNKFKSLIVAVSFISTFASAGEIVTKIDWVGDKYDSVIFEEVAQGEASVLLDFYTKLKARESQITFDEGIAFRKNFKNISRELEIDCTILDFTKTTKLKSVSCHFTVNRLQANSYQVTFYEFRPKYISINFSSNYANEVFNLINTVEPKIDISYPGKFKISGDNKHFEILIQE